jgi:orotidine-5'-phosphate decarboxylase
LYEDRANSVVSADIYKTLMARYEEEMKEKEREIEKAGKLGITESAESIKNIEVSRNLLQILLKGIWIDPKEGKVQSVRISYRFEENVLP